eukprot:gene303-923_t
MAWGATGSEENASIPASPSAGKISHNASLACVGHEVEICISPIAGRNQAINGVMTVESLAIPDLSFSPALSNDSLSADSGGQITSCVSVVGGQPKHLTLWQAVLVQIMNSVGASILFYPYLFASLGFVVGTIFLIVAAIVQGVMVYFMYRAIKMARNLYPDAKLVRMEDICQLAFGPWSKWPFFILLNTSFALVATTFLILTGEIMTGYVNLSPGVEVSNIPVSNWYWSLIFGIPQLILTFAEDLHGIRHLFRLGGFAVVVNLFVQVIRCSVAISDNFTANTADVDAPVAVPSFNAGFDDWKLILGSFTTFVYGFTAIFMCPQVVHDMGPNEDKYPRVILISHVLVLAVYALFGMLGFAAYGSAAPPSYLDPESIINQDEYFVYWAIGGAAVVTATLVPIAVLMFLLNRGLERLLPSKYTNSWTAKIILRNCAVLVCIGMACTPVSYFKDLSGLWPMCTTAFLSEAFPAAWYWAFREKTLSKQKKLSDADRKTRWQAAIADAPINFLWAVSVCFLSVVVVVFGFWESWDSLIANINGK